jgi:hypothetical protein
VTFKLWLFIHGQFVLLFFISLKLRQPQESKMVGSLCMADASVNALQLFMLLEIVAALLLLTLPS